MSSRPRSPLSLVVLALVWEEPMHPYRMQTLIKERGKDEVANVAQRNSVYQTIAGLRRAGLIAVRETSRDERRPERTVYEITDEGRQRFQEWMRTVISMPAREFPDFPAALSLLAALRPDEAHRLFEARIGALETRLVQLEQPVPAVPRLFLLESEYMAAVIRAEIGWLRLVIADLLSKRLTWSKSWVRREGRELAAAITTAAVGRERASRTRAKTLPRNRPGS
jgi:DNA-binding PadR family transcriptional regulator